MYMEKINDLALLLNTKGRSKKGVNTNKEIIKILVDVKQSYGIELSTEFLFNLMSGFTTIQKRRKIQNLFIGMNKIKEQRFFRELEQMVYNKNVVEYGLNKWNEPIIKKIDSIRVGKEFVVSKHKNYRFVQI